MLFRRLAHKISQLTCFSFRLLLLLPGLFFFSSGLFGQELTISSIDSSRYPEIKVTVLYTGKKKFDQAELQISQVGKPLAFQLAESSPGSAPAKGRSVFFLVESSGNTHGKALKELKEGISGSLDNLEAQDLVNVAWFSSEKTDSSAGGYHRLYENFSNSHESLKSELLSKINAKADTGHRVDLFKSILSSLEYIGSQTNLPKNRLFIVLSTGRDNSQSNISSTDCVNKAKELEIPVYAITYPPSDTAFSAGLMMNRICIRTGGKNILARSQMEIINALSDFFSIPVPAYMQEASYDLVFQVQPENGLNFSKVELNYRGARHILTVSDGNNHSLIPDDYKIYLWVSIGILGLVVLIMILVNIFSGRGKKQESIDIVEDIIKTTPLVKPLIQEKQSLIIKAAPITKQASEEIAVPVVLVSIEGRTATYPLNQPEITIGRQESNDICLAEQTVTGKHAVIHIKGKEISISDLGSTNGTFVNGERIRNKQLQHGDKIRLGKVELTLKK